MVRATQWPIAALCQLDRVEPVGTNVGECSQHTVKILNDDRRAGDGSCDKVVMANQVMSDADTLPRRAKDLPHFPFECAALCVMSGF